MASYQTKEVQTECILHPKHVDDGVDENDLKATKHLKTNLLHNEFINPEQSQTIEFTNTIGISRSSTRASLSVGYPLDIPFQDNTETFPPDGGVQAWLVMLASFLCNGIIFGIMHSTGAIYVALRNKFENDGIANSEARASLIGSLLIGSIFILSPITGVLVDRFGIRKTAFGGGFVATLGVLLSSFCIDNFVGLCFTFSIMFGAGSSLVYTPSVVILGHYFNRYHGIVNGFVTTGSSLFGAALPHLLKFLFAKLGIPNTLRVIAGMISILMLASLTFKPVSKVSVKSESTEYESRKKHNCCSTLVNVENWKNTKYVIWTIAAPIAFFGYFVPYVHIVAYVRDILPDSSGGESLMTCIAVTAGVGKIVFGWVADRPKVNPICLQQISYVFLGVTTMLYATAPYFGEYAYASLIAFSLVMGLFDGCFSTMLGPIAVKICGQDGASQAIGFLLGLCSFPLALGPFFAGMLKNHFKSYQIVFFCAGCPPIIGAIIMCGVYFKRSNIETNNNKEGLEM